MLKIGHEHGGPHAGSADILSAQLAKQAKGFLFALRAQCGRDARAPSR